MRRVTELTDEELRGVYMAMEKEEVIEMLINCNNILKTIAPTFKPHDNHQKGVSKV